MTPTLPPPGARESNAGDAFHVLWALSRALRMLRPETGLQNILMEGMSPLDLVAADPTMLHGVDLTEYFFGDRFDEADRVVISQLKYSSRNPEQRWTPGRLSSASSGRPSVFRRLGEVFAAHVRAHGPDATAAKLHLHLVSNQPPAPALAGLLRKVHANLGTHPGPVPLSVLSAGLTSRQRTSLGQLYGASGLSQRDFSTMMRLFSIENLGAGSLDAQEYQILQTLGNHVLTDVGSALNDLYRLFVKEALPAGAESTGVSRERILVELGASSFESLFPLPPRHSDPECPIPTADVESLAEVITAGHQRIVAHGVAGVGKTTTLGLLAGALPAGSTVIRYDCFGGGAYLNLDTRAHLNPAEPRHDAEAGLTQLINMLSVETGTALLVRGSTEHRLWKHFERSLSEAARTLPDGAHLVVAFDAADNSITAAETFKRPSFIPQVWDLPLPDRVHVVMTARSHRLEGLRLPGSAALVALEGFDEAASAAHLRQHFVASDEECTAFHVRSRRNPRIQFYVLDPSRPHPPADAAEAVVAAKLTPEEIFADLVTAATLEVSDPNVARRHLADLLCLSRPATVPMFAAATSQPVDAAARFCDGLVPGLVIEDGTIRFQDEDFDTYVRKQLTADEMSNAHRRLGAYLMSVQDSNPYAAAVCAEHLYLGGMNLELVDLAVDQPQPEVIADPIARVQAYFRRIELAMLVAEEPAWRNQAVPLTLLAATAAASRYAVANIVRKRPDLAMQYADLRSVDRIFEGDPNAGFKGVQHLRLAGMYADDGDLAAAEEQFRLADAWLHKWSTRPDHARHRDDFDEDDLAMGLRALRAFAGSRAVQRYVMSWRPAAFRLKMSDALVRDLATAGQLDVDADLLALRGPAWLRARLLAVAAASGVAIPAATLRAIASAVLNRPPKKEWRGELWQLEFGELLMRVTRDEDLTRRWFRLFKPQTPSHGPSSFDGLGDWTPTVRRAALLAALDRTELTPEDVVPAAWRLEYEVLDDSVRRRREDAKSLVAALSTELSVWNVRAQVFAGRAGVPALRRVIDGKTSSRSNRWRDDFNAPRPSRWIGPLLEACAACKANAGGLVDQIGVAVRASDVKEHWLAIEASRVLLRSPRFRDRGLEWLTSVADATATAEEPASATADRLLDLASLAHAHDPELARSWFLAAIEAADGLDDDGAGVFAVHADMATRCTGLDDDRRARIGHRMAEAIESYQFAVSEADRLPWRETLRAVTRVHPPSGFALLTRWDHEDHVRVGTSLPIVARAAVDSDYVDPLDAAGLLFAAGPDAFSFDAAQDLLGRVLDRRPRPPVATRKAASDLVDRMARLMIRDSSSESRRNRAGDLAAWARERSLRSDSLTELDRLAEFVAVLPEENRSGLQWRDGTLRRKPVPALPSDLAALPAVLDQLIEPWPDDEVIVSFLKAASQAIPAGQRVAFLNALADLPAGHRLWGRGDVLIRFIGERCKDWRSRLVGDWARTRFPQLVVERFAHLIPYEQRADETLDALETANLVDDLGGLILRATGPMMGELSSGQLFAIARSLARSLPEADRADALEWSMTRFDVRALGPVSELAEPEVLAQFLWLLLGHPERLVRWSAMHGARVLLPTRPDVFALLLARPRNGDVGGALPPGGEFFWMSALQHLLLLLRRLAHQHPQLVAPHVDWLVDVAVDVEFPHASIRELARLSALHLHHSSAARLPAARMEQLMFANMPLAARIAPRHEMRAVRFNDRDDKRFHFSSLDTIPYWFEPFGKMFELTGSEVAALAERWIVDVFGFDKETVAATVASTRDRFPWQETNNHQGSLSSAEDLHGTLEYHSMLLCAGELIDAGTPVVSAKHDWDDERWPGWIAKHLDVFEDSWVADRRTPAPLEAWAFGILPDRDRWQDRTPSDFDAELALGESIVVHASRWVSRFDRYETAAVSSALVSPPTALALLRAMQSSSDRGLHDLPVETDSDEDWRDGREVDVPGFRLAGWIDEVEQHCCAMEHHDPFRRVSGGTVMPGSLFRTTLVAAPGEFGMTQLVAGEAVASMASFSDEGPGRGRASREASCSGHRTTVDLTALLRFLAHIELDLILQVRITRQKERAGYGGEDDYDHGERRIYLLRRNGWLETVDGRHRVGRAPRSTAQLR